jgi:hypothetical protein
MLLPKVHWDLQMVHSSYTLMSVCWTALLVLPGFAHVTAVMRTLYTTQLPLFVLVSTGNNQP